MTLSAQHILLVEDSPTQAHKLSVLLEAEHFEVICCASAEDALREVSNNLPGLLVVDYYLPGIRGDELCRRIRMNIQARQIPILMFTVDDTQAMELRGLDAGADDYISKAADPEILVARIRLLLRKGQQSQAILGVVQPHLRDIWMLAVDDSPTYLEKIVYDLESEGYLCDKANSGMECLNKLKQKPFDCIVLDLVMPDMDGIEVCQKISEMRGKFTHPLAVLMLTAKEGKEDLTRALEAGADDFVGKSSDSAVLKGRIRALLRRNFYLDENRKIIEELKGKEMDAIRAHIEKEAAQARASLSQKLEETNRDLELANKELEAFCYSVSHDLRAPLRAVVGFSQALQDDFENTLPKEGKELLQRIGIASRRMAQLIEDLLSLSRVVRQDLRKGELDLSKLAREIIDDIRLAEPKRSAEFVIADHMIVNGDAGLLRAALDNLLRNAWKFTSKCQKTRIELGCTDKDGKKVYFLKDNGAGFDMAYADKLFGAFQRLHTMNEFPGTGIGLATVQRIVHRHGGRIWAEAAINQGATFYFTL